MSYQRAQDDCEGSGSLRTHQVLLLSSAGGYLLCLVWHALAFVQPDEALSRYWLIVFVGTLVVMVPSALYQRRIIRRLRRRTAFSDWRALFTGAPKWLTRLTGGTILFVMAEFLVTALSSSRATIDASSLDILGSAYGMVFYAVAAFINATAIGRRHTTAQCT